MPPARDIGRRPAGPPQRAMTGIHRVYRQHSPALAATILRPALARRIRTRDATPRRHRTTNPGHHHDRPSGNRSIHSPIEASTGRLDRPPTGPSDGQEQAPHPNGPVVVATAKHGRRRLLHDSDVVLRVHASASESSAFGRQVDVRSARSVEPHGLRSGRRSTNTSRGTDPRPRRAAPGQGVSARGWR